MNKQTLKKIGAKLKQVSELPGLQNLGVFFCFFRYQRLV